MKTFSLIPDYLGFHYRPLTDALGSWDVCPPLLAAFQGVSLVLGCPIQASDPSCYPQGMHNNQKMHDMDQSFWLRLVLPADTPDNRTYIIQRHNGRADRGPHGPAFRRTMYPVRTHISASISPAVSTSACCRDCRANG